MRKSLTETGCCRRLSETWMASKKKIRHGFRIQRAGPCRRDWSRRPSGDRPCGSIDFRGGYGREQI